MPGFVSRDDTAVILHVPSGKTMTLGAATSIAFFPDSSRIAVLNEGSVTIYQIEPLSAVRVISLPTPMKNSNNPNKMEIISVSPNGGWLVCSTKTATVQILNSDSLRVVYEPLAHRNGITDIRWLGPTCWRPPQLTVRSGSGACQSIGN